MLFSNYFLIPAAS